MDAPNFATGVRKYFVTKIDVIQRKLDVQNVNEATPVEPFTDCVSVPPLVEFKTLSERDVKSNSQRSGVTFCSLDPMPSRLVSKCDSLMQIITEIINRSLRSGHVPAYWEKALVRPLLKKLGLEFIFTNFRPHGKSGL